MLKSSFKKLKISQKNVKRTKYTPKLKNLTPTSPEKTSLSNFSENPTTMSSFGKSAYQNVEESGANTRFKHPSYLRGKEIGLWYAQHGGGRSEENAKKLKTEVADLKSVLSFKNWHKEQLKKCITIGRPLLECNARPHYTSKDAVDQEWHLKKGDFEWFIQAEQTDLAVPKVEAEESQKEGEPGLLADHPALNDPKLLSIFSNEVAKYEERDLQLLAETDWETAGKLRKSGMKEADEKMEEIKKQNTAEVKVE